VSPRSFPAVLRAVPAAARTVAGRFAALPPMRRRVAVGLVIAVVIGAGVTSAFAATTPGPTGPAPTAVRTADRASRGEARPTTTTAPPASATPAPPAKATTAPPRPVAPKVTTKAPTPRATAPKLPPAPAGCSAWHGNQLTACRLLASFGFSTSQMSALNQLWAHESGWSTSAANPSGAYGIPQALPGSKMATAGSDWRTSAATQIRWGLSYIKGRYGSPAAAWSYWQAHGWY
jgi:hypothetical protein